MQGAAQYRRSTSGGRIGAKARAVRATVANLESYDRVSKSDEIRARCLSSPASSPCGSLRLADTQRTALCSPQALRHHVPLTCRSQMIRSRSLMTHVASLLILSIKMFSKHRF